MGRADERGAHDDEPSFAYLLAHELKNPVMGIKGLASTGARMYDSMTEDERHEFFRLMDEEANRLVKVAELVGTALLAEAGELSFDISVQDLAPLVDEVLRNRGSNEVLVEKPADPQLRVRCDPLRAKELLSTVLDMALGTGDTGPPVTMRINSARGEGVRVEFETRSGGEEPAGIGRSLARALAEAQSGRFFMESAAKTTIIGITLPEA